MSQYRPEGYYDEVIARGTIVEDFLEIDPKSYSELLAKYRPNKPEIINKPCCGHQKSGSFPPLMKQAKNVMEAAGRVATAFIQGKDVRAPQSEVEKRVEICKECEFNKNGRCLKCGCYWKAKMRLITEHCPIKKW